MRKVRRRLQGVRCVPVLEGAGSAILVTKRSKRPGSVTRRSEPPMAEKMACGSLGTGFGAGRVGLMIEPEELDGELVLGEGDVGGAVVFGAVLPGVAAFSTPS